MCQQAEQELHKATCTTVGANHYTPFAKIGESRWTNTYLPTSAERRVVVLHNMALHLSFDNHEQAILKIPAKQADPWFFSTTSEAVTMEFRIRMRRAWNWFPEYWPMFSGTTHSSEWTTMERLDGVALEKWWEKMRKAYVTRILNLDCAFESALHGQIGSSYVEEDVVDMSAVVGEPGQGGPWAGRGYANFWKLTGRGWSIWLGLVLNGCGAVVWYQLPPTTSHFFAQHPPERTRRVSVSWGLPMRFYIGSWLDNESLVSEKDGACDAWIMHRQTLWSKNSEITGGGAETGRLVATTFII